jgi:hypothetical protein
MGEELESTNLISLRTHRYIEIVICDNNKLQLRMPRHVHLLDQLQHALSCAPIKTISIIHTKNTLCAVILPRRLIPCPSMSIAMYDRYLPLALLKLNPRSTFPRRCTPLAPISKILLEYKLTSQPNILRNNLQILGLPQLWTQRATPLHNLLSKLLIPLIAPITVISTATENHAAAEGAREHVCGCWVDAFGAADVPVKFPC